jgi:hypothetical protein
MKSRVSIVEIVCAEAAIGSAVGTAAGVSSGVAAAVVAVGGAAVSVADVVVVAVVVAVAVTASFVGSGFFIRSGKSFGATAAQSQRNPIEISTATKIRFSISRDRVPTSRIERVAAGEPPQAEPDAAQCAVLFDRLHHVNRAGGIETAHRRQQWREKSLVKTERCESEGTHSSSGGAALGRDAVQGAPEVQIVFGPGSLGGVRFDVHDNVQRETIEAERPALLAVDLASPSFKLVAHVRFAALLGRGDTDPRARQTVGDEEQNAVAGKEFAAGFVDAKELATFRQSFLFRQSLGAGGKSAGIGWQRLDRQALAALAAAARKHRLPVFGPHPDQKAVRALAAAVVWLIRTLHNFVNPLKRKRGV